MLASGEALSQASDFPGLGRVVGRDEFEAAFSELARFNRSRDTLVQQYRG